MRNIKKYAFNKDYKYKVIEDIKGTYGFSVVEVMTDDITTYKITHLKDHDKKYVVELIINGWDEKEFNCKTQKEVCERITGMEFLKNR